MATNITPKMCKKLKKSFVSLVTLLSLVALFAFALALSPSLPVLGAEAKGDETGSSFTDAEVNEFAPEVITGASVTLICTDTVVNETPGTDSVAEVDVARVATITFSDKIKKAFSTGKLQAEVYVSGHNTFVTGSGSLVSESADYVVGGALVGSGSLLSHRGDFSGIKLDTVRGNNFDNLTFTYNVKCKAEDRAIGMSGTQASVSVDAEVNLTIAFTFASSTVTIEVQRGGILYKGGVMVFDENATERTVAYEVAFDDALDYKVEPSQGYYFAGWKFSSMDVRPGKTAMFGTAEEPVGFGYQMYEDISVTALFQKISFTGLATEYSYDTLEIGPMVVASLGANYDVVDKYSGTPYDVGATVLNMSLAKPVYAGEYAHYAYVYYKNSEHIEANMVGYAVNEFVIAKNVPNVERADGNITEQTINYGGTLEEVNLGYSARNSANISQKVYGTMSIWLGEEEITDLEGLLPANDAGVEYTIRFTPNDTNNYEKVDMALKIFVVDKIKCIGINANGSTRTFSLTKNEVTKVDQTIPNNSNNEVFNKSVIKISLRAEMTDTDNRYFFIGWRIGLQSPMGGMGYTYLTAGKESGLEYDYYIPRSGDLKGIDDDGNLVSYTPEDIAVFTSAEFVAVFVRDDTVPTSGDTIYASYTGGSSPRDPKFTPQNAGYGFGATVVEYYDSDGNRLPGAPSLIGSYKIKYSIKNTELDVVVGNQEINYVIRAGSVQADFLKVTSEGSGNYNSATGWAQKKFYSLSVRGALPGSISKYYYKALGGEWFEVEGDIENKSGCAIVFATPSIEAGVSAVNTYEFKAVDASGNVVASTADGAGVECKIDNTSPAVTDLECAYGGGWTKADVVGTLQVSYGGSGAVLEVSYGNGRFEPLQTSLSYLTGTDTTYVTQTVEFRISREFAGVIRFRIRSGVGVTTVCTSDLSVYIDKTAPVLGDGIRNNNVNENGWIGSATEISFTIVDIGSSGIASVVSDDIEVLPKEGSVDTYCITVTDSARYIVVVYDNAGNRQEREYFAPVDTDGIDCALTSDFVAGSWTNVGVEISFEASVGASGARLLYKVNNGNYVKCDEGIFEYGNVYDASVRTVALSYVVNMPDGEYNYAFRIENGAGEYVDYEFGGINFDTVAPEFYNITDLSDFQGDFWTSNEIYAEFDVEEVSAVKSGIKSVVSDNGGIVTYSEESGKYRLVIDKCTPFTVTVTDNAGNVKEYVLVANVDTVTPTLSISAYVGGGDPSDIGVLPSAEDNADEYLYNFNDWITQRSKVNATTGASEAWLRIEFTINLTASGSAIEISNNNGKSWQSLTEIYRPEEGAITGEVSTRTYITAEQNNKYKFRLATGSGRHVYYDPIEDGTAYVRIDFTSPGIALSVYSTLDNDDYPVEDMWTYEDAVWRFSLKDSLKGSGVDAESVKLYEYSADLTDEDILADVASGTDVSLERSGVYYIHTFVDYHKYLLVFNDLAGNAYQGVPFAPMVDKTCGFTVDLSAETVGETEENGWLADGAYVKVTATPIFGAEYTAFGASGGYLEFSVDGGGSWLRSIDLNGDILEVTEQDGAFVFDTDADQNYTYLFRITTGAGVVAGHDGSVTVKRDGVAPVINAVAKTADGNSYDGAWTNKDVIIELSTTYGMAGGRIEVSTDGGDTWTTVSTVAPNFAATDENSIYEINYSTDATYEFRYSGDNGAISPATAPTAVKLDNTPVTATVVAQNEAGSAVTDGDWTYGSVTVAVIGGTGISGIATVEVAYKEGDGEFGDYVAIDAGDGGYSTIFATTDNARRVYKFTVTANSGMVTETTPFAVNIDNAEADFTVAFNGTKVTNSDGVFIDWYVSTVDVEFAVSTEAVSGYKLYVKYEERAEDGSFIVSDEWTEVGTSHVLGLKEDGTPDDRAGGLDRRYYFKSITGAGKTFTYDNGATDGEYMPIDLHDYSVTFISKVGDRTLTPDLNYTEYTNGEGSGYKRGDVVALSYVSNDGYYRKSYEIIGLTENVAGTNGTFNTMLSMADSGPVREKVNVALKRVYVGGQDVEFRVNLRKEICVNYENTVQYLQKGSIAPLSVVVKEEVDDKFVGFFGTVGFDGADVGLTATYNGNVAIPEDIGVYSVVVGASNPDDFIVAVDSCQATLTVVYFTGEGTKAEPYPVYGGEDFEYIDRYMSSNTAYDFLGDARRDAYFRQMCDIYVEDLVPMGTSDAVFGGTYDGFGYRVTTAIGDTVAIRGDFGLFAKISGASIINLGVELKLNYIGGDGAHIGLLAGVAENSGIRECYAIGEIKADGKTDITIGGIVGKAENTLVSGSFADVSIHVNDSSGYVGGVVGKTVDCFTTAVYTVSRITITDSARYSGASAPGAKILYAGAVSGYFVWNNLPGSVLDVGAVSGYLKKNISYDGSIEDGLSLGNYELASSLRHEGADIDAFATDDGSYANKLIHNIVERNYSISVRALVARRISDETGELDVKGYGTSDRPFIMDNAEKLALLSIFPWAYFKQDNDIVLGECAGYAREVPFVGVYDGAGYALINPVVKATINKEGEAYGGLFGVVGGIVRDLNVVDIAYDYEVEGTAYIGGLVGYLTEGGRIEDVAISGMLDVRGQNAIVFVGGAVGVQNGANVVGVVSVVGIGVVAKNAAVGGLTGLVKGKATLSDSVTMSSVRVTVARRTDTGTAVGAIGGNNAVTSVGYLGGNCFIDGKLLSAPVGIINGNSVTAVEYAYKDLSESGAGVTANGKLVSDVIRGLYPFEGSGTVGDPFKITNYRELLLVGNYMYASFVLANDIVVGDYDNDGLADEDYEYDYEPIGRGATFTGKFSGDGHAIFGLTDSLFMQNAGEIKNVILNVNYKIYARESDVPDADKFITATNDTIYKAKIASPGKDVLFGAVARINREGGTIIRVIVTGEVVVRTPGTSKVIIGGVVGIDFGGQIIGCSTDCAILVRASSVEVGGTIGVVTGTGEVMSNIGSNRVITRSIDVGAGTVRVGAFVGSVTVVHGYTPEYNTSSTIKVNGAEIGTVYVGHEK